ncbi:MAG: ABC transporter substrate-binding protein [Lachnospiraceae bacterium]|nr:ABC transporter substrate-binding protein [Lachnospiraceae bacterium]MDD3615565.1 ABC transporter substrate-binding protein [Lachnospiraceae bacterium]
MKALKIVSLLAVSALLVTGCGAGSSSSSETSTDSAAESSSSESDELIVATEAGFAPYEYMKGNEVVGVDMDIAQAIADEMGKTLVIQNMDFDAALVAVQQGKVDFAAAGISVDPEREKVMDFSTNYVDSTEVVVVSADAPAVTEPTGEALMDKVVAVQQGNIADLWCSNTDNTTPKEVRRYTKFALAAEDLKAGKVDCIVMDELPAKDLVEANTELKILEGDPLFQDQYAIAVKKGNTEMLDQINGVVEKLVADGKIDEFIANHSAAEAE